MRVIRGGVPPHRKGGQDQSTGGACPQEYPSADLQGMFAHTLTPMLRLPDASPTTIADSLRKRKSGFRDRMNEKKPELYCNSPLLPEGISL